MPASRATPTQMLLRIHRIAFRALGPSSGPVGTITSKSDPLTRDSDSSPVIRRSGAIESSQLLPLSATNMP